MWERSPHICPVFLSAVRSLNRVPPIHRPWLTAGCAPPGMPPAFFFVPCSASAVLSHENSLPGRPAASETAAAEGMPLRVPLVDSGTERGVRRRMGMLWLSDHHRRVGIAGRARQGALGKKRRRWPWARKYAPRSRETQSLAVTSVLPRTQACLKGLGRWQPSPPLIFIGLGTDAPGRG